MVLSSGETDVCIWQLKAFVDHHLKPLVAAVQSDVTDTNDFLKKFRDISTLPSGAIMVTIDVVGLYPIYPMISDYNLSGRLSTIERTRKYRRRQL